MPQYSNPLPRTGMPHFHESSPQRTLRDSDSIGKVWIKDKTISGQVSSMTRAVSVIDREVKKLKRRINGGGESINLWPWMYPDHVEGDSTQIYSKGKLMYLSALNPLVVTGLVDRVSGATVTACQGIWLAMDDVSPVGGDGKWDMPQFPYPNAAATMGGAAVAPGTVAPSGTPLKGDWDTVNPADGSIYPKWRYLGDVPTP